MIDWEDLWTLPFFGLVAEKVEPWLPIWLGWLLALPFFGLAILVAIIEWFLRMIFTPQKFLNRW